MIYQPFDPDMQRSNYQFVSLWTKYRICNITRNNNISGKTCHPIRDMSNCEIDKDNKHSIKLGEDDSKSITSDSRQIKHCSEKPASYDNSPSLQKNIQQWYAQLKTKNLDGVDLQIHLQHLEAVKVRNYYHSHKCIIF